MCEPLGRNIHALMKRCNLSLLECSNCEIFAALLKTGYVLRRRPRWRDLSGSFCSKIKNGMEFQRFGKQIVFSAVGRYA